MSITEDDTELRDLVVQTLDSNGVLGKIKAQVRASVFLALGEEERKNPLENDELSLFSKSTEGSQVIALFQEFLKFFDLEYTLAVFDPETNASGHLGREKIAREFGISDVGDVTKRPLICELLRRGRKSSHPFEGRERFDLDRPSDENVGLKKSVADSRLTENRRNSQDNDGNSTSSIKLSTDSMKSGRLKRLNAQHSDDDNSGRINSLNSTPRDVKSADSPRTNDDDDNYDEDIEEDIEADSSINRSDSIGKDEEMTSDRTLSPGDQSIACDYIEDVLKTQPFS